MRRIVTLDHVGRNENTEFKMALQPALGLPMEQANQNRARRPDSPDTEADQIIGGER